LKSIKGIWVVGEKQIFSELAKIFDIATEASIILSNMFKTGYKEEELTKAMHAIQVLEKKSDEIAFKISEDITSGAISPNIIDNLLDSVQTADDIIDTYYYISRELNRMAGVCSDGFREHYVEWDSVYENMLALAEKSLLSLRQALSSADKSKILRMRKEVEDIEEQGDDIKDQGFDRLYRIAPKLHFLEFYHYQELLHKCDDILDSCEDFSDLIVSVVTSILK